MAVFRTSTIENLTELFGLHGGMRAAARMIREADEVLLDVPHEAAEYVPRVLGKPIVDPARDTAVNVRRPHRQGTPSQRRRG